MDFIEEFINRYTKEYDFYAQVGRIAAQELETTLQAAGIRSIVTHRAKSVSRLRAKCVQRHTADGRYNSVDDIYDDIVDLTGVRVALYFPAERTQVDGVINRLFDVQEKKEFPSPDANTKGKRFTGYSALHYRVQLKERHLSEPDKRYARARIEIQVASILMHAWSEVEHDLIYKPLAGELSDTEHAILDQLNGLVISGEIALEMLQKAGEARVTVDGQPFANHYELAAHLIRLATDKTEDPISESGLGRVDLLFEFTARLGLNTSQYLARYVEALHGNLEERPLAEQISDALLAEDPTRYELYRVLQAKYGSAVPEDASDRQEYHRQLGIFLDHWIDLERLARELAVPLEVRQPAMPTSALFTRARVLPPNMMREFDQLRRLRSYAVHGVEPIEAAVLAEASQRLDAIKREIQERAAKLASEDRKKQED
ncbi:RelA/SpoT domain-containing protein [Streptosporangium sp. NPDC006930]|uniref:RelA/SpoT domain-containing protein n=1 Tax=Streptosporangium sp. NPDC006930 TaxID=3154783 RepID=UPI00342CBE0E